ncbi:MAG: signal peptidase I [Verrucomicrobiota bacterium]
MNRRIPWLATILSLFCPGLGQLYSGFVGRALGFLVASWVLSAILTGFLFLGFYQISFGAAMEPTAPSFVLQSLFTLVVGIDAWRLASRQNGDFQLAKWNRPGVYVLFSLVYFLSFLQSGIFTGLYVREVFFQAFKIPTQSMSPTLQPGDHIVANKHAYHREDPKPGDLVTFPSPENRRQIWIKRVVATGGQSIEIRDGQLIIDGEALVRGEDGMEINAGVRYGVSPFPESLNFGPQVVPLHSVFVLGDNRERSKDSRHIGSIAITSLTGRVDRLYWPPGRPRNLAPEPSD